MPLKLEKQPRQANFKSVEIEQAPILDANSMASISEINTNLTQLNDQILNRQPEAAQARDDDAAFSRAIRDLKKYVLAE